ncbi:hypothetical protein [Shewanella sp. NFH-SH190041]|uniref:hypothetical protein n=1 Tax=Shewanella sp. NFH-SH190041 TaxID=2950245 RepID=UPI0021C4081F|nr:hypothetical protein [Shewanella sp. NFH-SH190041]
MNEIKGKESPRRFLSVFAIVWLAVLLGPYLLGSGLLFGIMLLLAVIGLMSAMVEPRRPLLQPVTAFMLPLLLFTGGVVTLTLPAPQFWPLLPLLLSLPLLWQRMGGLRQGTQMASCHSDVSSSLAAADTTSDVQHQPSTSTGTVSQRVEPVFGATLTDATASTVSVADEATADVGHIANSDAPNSEAWLQDNDNDTGFTLLPFWLAAKSAPRWALVSVAATLVLISVIMMLANFIQAVPDSADTETLPQSITVPALPTPKDQVKLPDGFALALQDRQLIFSWLGEKDAAGTLWSLATATGDSRCSELTFNDGSAFRPIRVITDASGETQAWFSPLDARDVIRNVAHRGNARLCGYRFSLKGTQSRLEAHQAFAPLL